MCRECSHLNILCQCTQRVLLHTLSTRWFIHSFIHSKSQSLFLLLALGLAVWLCLCSVRQLPTWTSTKSTTYGCCGWETPDVIARESVIHSPRHTHTHICVVNKRVNWCHLIRLNQIELKFSTLIDWMFHSKEKLYTSPSTMSRR